MGAGEGGGGMAGVSVLLSFLFLLYPRRGLKFLNGECVAVLVGGFHSLLVLNEWA